MSDAPTPQGSAAPRVAAVPAEAFKALAWIGPMLMLLGGAIGSGELLIEPTAGARYGGALLWVVVFAVVTKALWNEAIGRVSIVTGQSFLEVCAGAGPVVSWVPWAWYAVNVIKDFLLRGGIMAIGGLICYDVFGPLPAWMLPPASALPWLSTLPVEEQADRLHVIVWTFLNFSLVWLLLVAGGYRLAEKINTVLCLVFTFSLMACAAKMVPRVTGELASGLIPRLPSQEGELMMLVSLIGIVMSGSATIYYSAWVEEREMGLFGHARGLGRRLVGTEFQPQSEEEIRRMCGWLRVNRINVTLAYVLGALLCFSTFVLGVAVLRPAGVTLKGAELAPELSLMMTKVIGPWAKTVFYIGTWAAVASTIVAIFDGSSRIFVQPLRRHLPAVYSKLSFGAWQKILMTMMMFGSFSVYALKPDALTLVLWMGAVDAPLVGILILAYVYLAKRYIPEAYRSGVVWSAAMLLVGLVYLAFGAYWGYEKVTEALGMVAATAAGG